MVYPALWAAVLKAVGSPSLGIMKIKEGAQYTPLADPRMIQDLINTEYLANLGISASSDPFGS